MRWLILFLITVLITEGARAEEVTTSNLLDQNFDNGSWSGTADGRHGSNVIAAHNDEYIVSDDISLANDANLTQEQINDGFTTNHSFKYWHWNNFNSTVQSTVTIIDSSGETTTQTRTYNSTGCGYINCGSYNTGSDSLSISRNSQTDYNINVRYDFSDTSNSTGHYGVDLKEPSLTVTYESDPVRLDTSLENEIIELFDDFKPEDDIKLDEPKFEDNFVALPEPSFAIEEEFKMEDDFKMEEPEYEEPSFEEPMVMEMPEEPKEEEPVMEMVMEFIEEDDKKEEEPQPMEVTEMPDEKPEEEKTTSELLQEGFKEEQEQNDEEEPDSETTETADAPEEDSGEQKEVQQKETKTVGLTEVLDKIDEKIKDIDKNLQLKNLVKLKVMASNNLLDAYNIPFYEPRIIYEDQINIQDNRIIYPTDLVEYKQNDPIYLQKKRVDDILQKRQNLLKELQVLQNG
jgi:acetyltransferase-like isoleucine patch superfamily enzyme